MKTRFTSSLLLGFLLSFFLPWNALADSLFGDALYIRGETFIWYSSNEYGDYHTDTYGGNNGNSVVVSGLISNPNIAAVSGNDQYEANVAGYLYNGSYGDLVQTGPANITSPWNRYYNTVTTSYSLDLSNSTLSSVFDYSDGFGDSFHVDSSGIISGSESGVLLNGIWYFDSGAQFNGVYQSPVGGNFTDYSWNITWYFDVNGDVQANNYQCYSGGDGYVNLVNNVVSSGDWTEIYAIGTQPGFYVFAQNYYLTSHRSYSSGGDNYEYYTYSSYSGGVYSYSITNGTSNGGQLWEPSFGNYSWTGDPSNPVFTQRGSGSFAPSQFYVNGQLMYYLSDQIDSGGDIGDTYIDGNNIYTVNILGEVLDFWQNSGNASVYVNGSIVGTYSNANGFEVSGYDFHDTSLDQTPLFINASSILVVNGTVYDFVGGYQDADGTRIDVYSHSGGILSLRGSVSASPQASVLLALGGASYEGSFNNSFFTMEDESISITIDSVIEIPCSFWIGERFFQRQSGTLNYFSVDGNGTSDTISLNPSTTSGAVEVSGTYNALSITGIFDVNVGGVFTLQVGQSIQVFACAADASGNLIAGSDNNRSSALPPAVRVQGENWSFLGVLPIVIDPNYPAVGTTFYGKATLNPNTQAPASWKLLQIPNVQSQADPVPVAWRDCLQKDNNGNIFTTYGSYNSQTHLFQSLDRYSGFPMPIYGIDPANNNQIWGVTIPDSTSGPATFTGGNTVWHYTGTDSNNTLHYQGNYAGQQLTVAAPGTDGVRLVQVYDNSSNTLLQGSLNSIRGDVRLSDGSTIYNGNSSGERIPPQTNTNNVQTIAGDLDISGNILSFGTLASDPSTAGVTLQFSEDVNFGTLSSAIGRTSAQWLWSRAANNGSTAAPLPVMKLDAQGSLNLYDPISPGNPTVTLVPSVDASDPWSSLPKLKLTHQPSDDTDPTNVLTLGNGDTRYLRSSGANQALTLTSGINVNTGGTTGSNTVNNQVDTGAAAIGQNLQARGGQVVVGRYNAPASANNANNAVFVVGAGTATSNLKNALSVSTTGNTSINGGLTVTGDTTLTGTTVNGGLAVNGSLLINQQAVLTQADGSSFSSQLDLINTALGNLPGTYVSKSSNTIAIGTGTTASQGQIVLGAYNVPSIHTEGVSDDLLIIGNGTSPEDADRSNAFVIKRNGDAVVQGGLMSNGPATVSGKATLNDSTGTAGVILDPTPDGVSMIRGVLRVRPGGDLPMAPEFQHGTQP